MNQAVECVQGICYKIRMLGIPCEETTFVYVDNQSVLTNTSVPTSTLKKKSNSIAFRFVQEGCVSDEWRTTYVNTNGKQSYLFTKLLSSGDKRWHFVRIFLY